MTMRRKLSLLLLFLLGVVVGPSLGDQCVAPTALSWQSSNGMVTLNGEAITIKGINWWGMETATMVPGGLQTRAMGDILDLVKNNGFNALRIPFSLDIMLNPNNRVPNSINFNVNPTLQGKTSVEVLDAIFDAAAARGLLILLDQHKFDKSEVNSDPLWYTTSCITNQDGVCKTYTIDDCKAGWNFVVNRYQSRWNFLGIDLLNEPHGAARWANGNPNSDWALASAEIGNSVISSFPNWKGFIFVEGVELNPNCEILGFPGCETCTNDGHWWGGNMEGIRCAGVALSDPTRLIYSPHVYGSSVYVQPYFSDPDFPNNLGYIYDTHFNFLRALTGRGIIIGEWGGFYSGMDKIIQDYQVQYFHNNSINCQFFWALNPNPGGDTDGLLNDDWTTPNTAKVNFLASAFPSSTQFSTSGSQICFTSSGGSSSSSSTASTAGATSGSATSSGATSSGATSSGGATIGGSSGTSAIATTGDDSGTTTDASSGTTGLGGSEGDTGGTSASARVVVLTFTVVAAILAALL